MAQNYSISESEFVEMAARNKGEPDDTRRPYTLIGRHIAADRTLFVDSAAPPKSGTSGNGPILTAVPIEPPPRAIH